MRKDGGFSLCVRVFGMCVYVCVYKHCLDRLECRWLKFVIAVLTLRDVIMIVMTLSWFAV